MDLSFNTGVIHKSTLSTKKEKRSKKERKAAATGVTFILSQRLWLFSVPGLPFILSQLVTPIRYYEPRRHFRHSEERSDEESRS